MTGSIHVVIVNWNTGHWLSDCLDALPQAATGAGLSRVTVVDNASSDGSADALDDSCLEVEVIRNQRNVGFGRACNQGAAGSDAEYLLFLNPDTRPLPGSVAVVRDFMDSDLAAGVGICGARILDEDGQPSISAARFPANRIFLGKALRLDRVAPARFPPHHLTGAETVQSRDVDQVIGAFFFVRRTLFEQLGGFDEQFFLYFEEVDLALRARAAGAGSYLLADAQVVHGANVSTDLVPAQRLHHSVRSRLLFARKHWSSRQVAILLAVTYGVELPARLLHATWRRRGAGGVLLAYLSALTAVAPGRGSVHPVELPRDRVGEVQV